MLMIAWDSRFKEASSSFSFLWKTPGIFVDRPSEGDLAVGSWIMAFRAQALS